MIAVVREGYHLGYPFKFLDPCIVLFLLIILFFELTALSVVFD